MFPSILIFLLGLSASLASKYPCTTVKFPPNAVIRGKSVPVKPIILRPYVQSYTLQLQNTCYKTSALVVRVCDYDVAPYVYPISLQQVQVVRSGQLKDVGMAFPEYYCEFK